MSPSQEMGKPRDGISPLRFDSELLYQFIGNEMEFTKDHMDYMSRIAYQMFGPRFLEEILGQSYIGVATSLHTFDPERGAKFKTWLYGIVKFSGCTVLEYLGADKRGTYIEHGVAKHSHIADERFAKDQLTLVEEMEHKKRVHKVVHNGLRRLKHKNRARVVRMKLKNKTVDQIAKKLNISKSAVSALTHRGRHDLHQLLEIQPKVGALVA